jgi:medium-chain acyl-[acyl-carrier-protein] hydrolase
MTEPWGGTPTGRTIAGPPQSPWFPFGTGDGAAIRLLCLPHGGAGANFYQSWVRGLPASIAGCPVQPPGRERRRSERPYSSAHELVRPLAQEIIRWVRPPYAVFGLSTGALCAFEVAREVRRLGGHLPVHLFVAGRRAPTMATDRIDLSGLSAAGLAGVLRTLGGTPEEVLSHLSLLELLRPLIVADFAVDDDYRYEPEPALPVPITAFAGTHDPLATPDQVAGWGKETTAGYTQLRLDGGHFAIFDHSELVLRRIAGDLEHHVTAPMI